jgi:hypothetical protein
LSVDFTVMLHTCRFRLLSSVLSAEPKDDKTLLRMREATLRPTTLLYAAELQAPPAALADERHETLGRKRKTKCTGTATEPLRDLEQVSGPDFAARILVFPMATPERVRCSM